MAETAAMGMVGSILGGLMAGKGGGGGGYETTYAQSPEQRAMMQAVMPYLQSMFGMEQPTYDPQSIAQKAVTEQSGADIEARGGTVTTSRGVIKAPYSKKVTELLKTDPFSQKYIDQVQARDLNFNVAEYLTMNPGVRKSSYGNSPAKVFEHYQQHGRAEGRAGTFLAANYTPEPVSSAWNPTTGEWVNPATGPIDTTAPGQVNKPSEANYTIDTADRLVWTPGGETPVTGPASTAPGGETPGVQGIWDIPSTDPLMPTAETFASLSPAMWGGIMDPYVRGSRQLTESLGQSAGSATTGPSGILGASQAKYWESAVPGIAQDAWGYMQPAAAAQWAAELQRSQFPASLVSGLFGQSLSTPIVQPSGFNTGAALGGALAGGYGGYKLGQQWPQTTPTTINIGSPEGSYQLGPPGETYWDQYTHGYYNPEKHGWT